MRFPAKLVLLAVGLLLSADHAPAQEKHWKAGVAKAVITPTEPMWMSGYSSRTKPAEGKVHDLWAKALVLEAPGGKACVLVTLDLVGIGRDISVSAAERIQKAHGFAREDVCFAVSHTHCGPVVGHNLNVMYFLDDANQKRVRDYSDELVSKIVDVVGQAKKNLAPAVVSRGEGFTTFATNRRNNKEADVPALRAKGKLVGPVDHQVPVISVRSPEGNLRAVLFGYACHATVLSFYQWCGDYPGFAQAALEEKHPGAVALFFAGCGADQNPLPRRTVELARQYGERLANAVDDVLASPMTILSPKVHTSYKEIDLPLGDLPSREQIVKDSMNKDKYVAARAKTLLETLKKAGSLKQTYPYPVQTWRLGGEVTLVTLGGEVVVDYALRLKRELGDVWVAGYANDVMAYIPSVRVLKEGGYEGASSMIYYGLPTIWSPRIEDMIISETARQLGFPKR